MISKERHLDALLGCARSLDRWRAGHRYSDAVASS